VSAGIESVLAIGTAPPCPDCHTELEVRLDAIGRTRTVCPRCRPRSIASATRHPDDAFMPQALVRLPRANALPPVAAGQLRCQRCARGVEGKARLCPSCQGAAHRASERSRRSTSPRIIGTREHPLFSAKVCRRESCERVFRPTGPNSQFCEAHR
jgi:hypothetical protein